MKEKFFKAKAKEIHNQQNKNPKLNNNQINNKILNKSTITFLLISIVLTSSLFQVIKTQDDFEDMQNFDQIQRDIYPNGGIGGDGPMGGMNGHLGGGAHPGYRNIDHGDMDMNNYRMHQGHRGGMGGGPGGHQRHHMGGHGRHNFNGGMNQQFHGSQDNMMGNMNTRSYGPFGIFSNSWMNTTYEIMMMMFFLSFVYNCFCGNNKNDKYALAWYNANKQYFEERYSDIGLKKDEDVNGIQDINTDSLPIIKENQYVYKFYASGYRYIKWLMVVLEFRKRHDMFSVFTTMIFNQKDRIVFEVGIEPLIENSGWVFCVCNKRDGPILAKDYQDINFFCSTSEPSIMSDRLILYSESDDLYCDLFQNRVI